MKIKFEAKTIEISKTFADRASHFGSMEYAELRSATNDLPDFNVVVKSTPKRRRTFAKGLTYDFMATYIASTPDGSALNEFLAIRNMCSYADVKKWFVAKFPEAQEFAA